MSGPFGSQQWMYSSGDFYPHEVDNSARLDSNSYYTRTPSSAGNRKTWTWSGWVKRGGIGTTDTFFAGIENDNNRLVIGFNTDSDITVVDVTGGSGTTYLQSNAQFRDPSSWYHFVISLDTTESTASDRLKIYVNGSELTSYSTDNRSSITLNGDEHINNTISHTIGTNRATGITYYNGYVAEINFIDGQTLDPTSFGETKSGVWIPNEYTGSYGTNGFYLDFATRATDPIDASGNGNNWGSVNVVSTDWMLDSPTNNFCTLNPLSGKQFNNNLITYSEGNLKGVNPVHVSANAVSTFGFPSTGKYYFEFLAGTRTSDMWVGAQDENGFTGNGTGYRHDGGISFNGSSAVAGAYATYTTGDIIGVALDMSGNTATYYKNGTQVATAPSGVDTKNYTTWVQLNNAGDSFSINFGQDSSFAGNKTAQGNTDANGIGDFYYAPPAGYLAICSSNLPDPAAAIDPALDANPQDYFNTVLYTGDGSTLAAGGQDVTGVGFNPDLVWLKHIDEANDHHVYDQVRGDYNRIFPNGTDAESTGGRLSFITDGFNVSDYDNHNKLNGLFVAWNWKFGGSGASNTVGTLTSTVSANQDLGMSIVTFTADGTNTSVGTGLSSSSPLDMVIIKRRDSTSEWQVGHRFSGQSTNFAWHLNLNDTSSLSGISPYYLGTSSTTAGHFLQLASGSYGVSSSTWVAYCFQSVEGFSKFGSYTGNGSADGPFVYTGFRPAFVMYKRTDSTGSWAILDTSRDIDNVAGNALFPDLSNAEYAGLVLDMVSNGFKIRDSATIHNASGGSYIFMAFAEMPFKYSTAR